MDNNLTGETSKVLDELIERTLEELRAQHPELNDEQLFDLTEKTVLKFLLD